MPKVLERGSIVVDIMTRMVLAERSNDYDDEPMFLSPMNKYRGDLGRTLKLRLEARGDNLIDFALYGPKGMTSPIDADIYSSENAPTSFKDPYVYEPGKPHRYVYKYVKGTANSVIGKNPLGEVVKTACRRAGMDEETTKKYTNHGTMTRCFVSSFKDNGATVNDYVQAGGWASAPTSLQRGCFRSDIREKCIHALSSPREMIARPKMSQNEWKTTEIQASKVGNFSPFSCPGPRFVPLGATPTRTRRAR